MSRTLLIRTVVGVVLLIAVLLFLQAPRAGEYPRMITVPEGSTLSEVSDLFKKEHIVVSSFLFKVFAYITGGSEGIKAGEYLFNEPPRLIVTAWRLTHADFRITPVRVLIPEGTSVQQMSDIFRDVFPSFATSTFRALAEPQEGYLFPDTYLFLPNSTPEVVVDALSKNFDEKMAGLTAEFVASGRTLSDIVTMASILEEEAVTLEDRRIVAGILWKRLDMDMALQVDAPFIYLMGKGSADLTLEDLKVDSPYNTYLYRGLPPTPITNPGLDSLLAAMTPTSSEYFFYLSDADGVIHYAKTFEQHKQNKELYLR